MEVNVIMIVKEVIFKSLTAVFFFGMIFMNFLANSLPLNNRGTGQISDDYPAYFTPSGFTFSIWGVIYVLLGIVVIKAIITKNSDFFDEYSMTFLILFLVTCVTNILWLLCWHYDKIFLSTVIMLIFLIVLVWITFFTPNLNQLTKITFSIYTGWVSIAFIANITILLVKNKIPIFQDNQVIWYVIVMLIGVILGLTILFMTRNVFYTGVYAWAYFGIFMKHLNQTGYYLTQNYNVFNGLLLAVLVIGISIVLYLNDFKWIK